MQPEEVMEKKRRLFARQTPKEPPQPEPEVAPEPDPQPEPPRDVATEIETLVRGFGGDLKKVEEYILKKYQGSDLYTAGFTIGLYAMNARIVRENEMRKALRSYLDGYIQVPFDPREFPDLLRIIGLSPVPSQAPQKKLEPQPEPRPQPAPRKHEDFTSKDEQKRAQIAAYIDGMGKEEV